MTQPPIEFHFVSLLLTQQPGTGFNQAAEEAIEFAQLLHCRSKIVGNKLRFEDECGAVTDVFRGDDLESLGKRLRKGQSS